MWSEAPGKLPRSLELASLLKKLLHHLVNGAVAVKEEASDEERVCLDTRRFKLSPRTLPQFVSPKHPMLIRPVKKDGVSLNLSVQRQCF